MGSDNGPVTMAKDTKVNFVKTGVMTLVPLAFGLGVATAIFKYGDTDKYEGKIASAASDDFHWIFLAIVIFGRMISFVNFVPAAFKKGLKGNVRSNPFFYKVDDADGKQVFFDSEGEAGMYNRANRSVHHMVENFGAFIAGMATVGSVFPFPTFVLTCVYSLGRVLHQAGYIRSYGGHAVGFLLANIVAASVMEGLSLIVFLKASEIM